MSRLFSGALMLVGAITSFLIALAFLQIAAPDVFARVDGTIRTHVTGWSEQACDTNPVECLTYQYDALSTQEEAVGSAISELNDSLQALERERLRREQLLFGNEALLLKGRQLLAEATEPWEPVTFAGRSYEDRETLRAQLELLFMERESLRSMIDQSSELAEQSTTRLRALQVRRGEIANARSILPSQIQMVEATGLIESIDTRFATITELTGSTPPELLNVRQLVGTTEELLQSMAESSGGYPDHATSRSFDGFLEDGLLNGDAGNRLTDAQ